MKRSIKQISLIVGLGTLLSKFGGLIRQLLIAGAFGIGAAYDAYNFAYVIPGFFLVLIGGINGPLHNSIVTVLSKRSKDEHNYITYAINTSLGLCLIVLSVILFFTADLAIKIIGPGLTEEVHLIAVEQLKIMSPIVFLSGVIGISFGTLNANNEFFIPSISPLISSISLIIAAAFFWTINGSIDASIGLELQGGIILAKATLIGALMQYLIQIPSLLKKNLFKFKLIWDLTNAGVKQVWNIAIPAILSSGMLQVNVVTDLFFASNIFGAAAGLGYANFLVQAPLGLISNSLIIPLLPALSKLSSQKDIPKLITKIKQGLMLSSICMISLGTIFIVLGEEIVSLIYGRGAFNPEAIKLVASLLITYGIGMPVYLARDLLVRVFYAIGDSSTPFKFSAIGIILNIVLDWSLIGGPSPWGNQLPVNFGAQGLILATVGVNTFTCIGLLMTLNRELGYMKLKQLTFNFIKLLISALISGLITTKINSIDLMPPIFIGKILELSYSCLLSILIFIGLAKYLKIKEIDFLIISLKQKINPR